MPLKLIGEVQLPAHAGPGAFDHGDVHFASGYVFIAHTANGTVEVVDGPALRHVETIPGCLEASGVLVAQGPGLVYAAARGDGKVLQIEVATGRVVRVVPVGPRPNGLAWDPGTGQLLVADVKEDSVRVVDQSGDTKMDQSLPGRPRWAVHDAKRGRFLVNIRQPAGLALIDPNGGPPGFLPVNAAGPHGLDIDPDGDRALIACDEGFLIALDLADGRELARQAIAGVPDATWFNRRRRATYVAVGDPGVVQVLESDSLRVAETIDVGLGTTTTAFDAERQILYVFQAETAKVLAYATPHHFEPAPRISSSG